MSQKKVLVLCGPTASGKTRLGIELALKYNGEVVSADSMQVYRGMDIGTAKPTAQEMGGVPHHMLDVADPRENYSVARYVAEASRQVDDILARGRLPILAGGTGLYLDALVAGRSFASFSGEIRAQLVRQAQTQGISVLYEKLLAVDPQRARALSPGDEKRIVRALEIWYETGQTMTEHDASTRTLPPRYQALYLGLSYEDRQQLKEAIDRRVDQMMEAGLLQEVEGLLKQGVPPQSTAMQAIGYKQLLGVVAGHTPLEEAVAEIKLRSRQYAKRQLTWFRRNEAIHWHLWGPVPDFSRALQEATKSMEDFGLL